MKHARLVCNQKEKFQCAECRTLTSHGYQLIGEGETKFVCRDCYGTVRAGYPIKGKSIKRLLPAELVFSEDYDPTAFPAQESDSIGNDTAGTGYIGELVPDGNGGWREPTAEELRAMNAQGQSAAPSRSVTTAAEDFSEVTVKYRFTTDNKLMVILPASCRIDGETYELVVITESRGG